MTIRTLRAVLYLRDLAHHAQAQRHCLRQGHRVIGVVYDPDGTRYPEVVDACLAGQIDVIVLRSLDDLPDGRVPRTEVLDQHGPPPAGPVTPRQRRPRRR